MSKQRGDSRRALWLRVAGVVVIVAVVVALAFFVRGFESTGSDDPVAGSSGTAPAPDEFASPAAVPSKSGKKSAKKYVVPGTGRTITLGAAGGGIKIDASNVHKLTARVTSSGPLYAIGYLIPTSLESPYGKQMHPGNSWAVTTSVNGKPDYAVIWVSAGKGGAPATCTISVDGKLLVSRTTSGSYGRQVCYA